MRPFMPALILSLLAIPVIAPTAFAQPAPPPPAMSDPAPTVTTPTPPPPAARPQRPRQTFAQRFANANTTHDGRLTLQQAQAARMGGVAKNFAAIDRENKGYVTKQDIAAYRKAMRTQRQGT
jgi:hypothetical protein